MTIFTYIDENNDEHELGYDKADLSVQASIWFSEIAMEDGITSAIHSIGTAYTDDIEIEITKSLFGHYFDTDGLIKTILIHKEDVIVKMAEQAAIDSFNNRG